MHIYQTKIKLHETDAAGVLFFTNQLKMVHDAYESLLERIGFSFPVLIRDKNFFLPIVHCESDFKSPLSVGDLIEIQVAVTHVGKTSFTLSYTLADAAQKTVGAAQTVHVSVDKATRSKIPRPLDLRAKMKELWTQDHQPVIM